MKLPSLAEVKKLVAVVVAGLTIVVATGQLNGYMNALAIVNDVIAIGQAVAVYGLKNADPEPAAMHEATA